MPSVRPPVSEAVWADLASRSWRRVRWRAGLGEDAVCAAYGTPIHREGTYYRRPAYTDGAVWLSQQAHDELRRRSATGLDRRSRPDR